MSNSCHFFHYRNINALKVAIFPFLSLGSCTFTSTTINFSNIEIFQFICMHNFFSTHCDVVTEGFNAAVGQVIAGRRYEVWQLFDAVSLTCNQTLLNFMPVINCPTSAFEPSYINLNPIFFLKRILNELVWQYIK